MGKPFCHTEVFDSILRAAGEASRVSIRGQIQPDLCFGRFDWAVSGMA